MVRDADEKVLGFALTRPADASTLEVVLLCSAKRKGGEGMRLFENVLRFCKDKGMDVVLDAINSEVARLYASAGRRVGFNVQPAGGTVLLDEWEVDSYLRAAPRGVKMRFLVG